MAPERLSTTLQLPVLPDALRASRGRQSRPESGRRTPPEGQWLYRDRALETGTAAATTGRGRQTISTVPSLREIRTARLLTIREFARLASVAPSTIHLAEAG